MRPKPWEARLPHEPRPGALMVLPGYTSPGAYPITDRTVVLPMKATKWFREVRPWLRQQKFTLINFRFVRDPLTGRHHVAATFRTKEHAALCKLFWYD